MDHTDTRKGHTDAAPRFSAFERGVAIHRRILDGADAYTAWLDQQEAEQIRRDRFDPARGG